MNEGVENQRNCADSSGTLRNHIVVYRTWNEIVSIRRIDKKSSYINKHKNSDYLLDIIVIIDMSFCKTFGFITKLAKMEDGVREKISEGLNLN